MNPEPAFTPLNPEEMTIEQRSLAEFAARLGSAASEPALLDSGVRKEAKLLMSLLASNAPDEGPGAVSSSDSSAVSDDSNASHSFSRREFYNSQEDVFFFSCPSLSLDPNSTATGYELICQNQEEPHETKNTTPARLLQRPLRIDSRDALWLSADAISRNLMQSFQKAIEWRLEAWKLSLSENIAILEQTLREKGASEQDIREEVLLTPEALLLMQLTTLKITVTDTITDFKLAKSNSNKRRKTQGNAFTTTQPLVLDCQLYFSTPAGNVQVALEVPGSIQGAYPNDTFDKSPEQLVHVSVQLDTDMLAAMMEKSTRDVVRASLEHVMQEQDSTIESLLSPAPTTMAPVITAVEVRTAVGAGLATVPDDLSPTSQTNVPFAPRFSAGNPHSSSQHHESHPFHKVKDVTHSSPTRPLFQATSHAMQH